WVKGEPGSVSPPTLIEKLLGARGWKRHANRARILGDVSVWTQQGLADRLRFPRPVSPPPRPATDPTAPRKPIDAAGTAAFPFGAGRWKGHGNRAPILGDVSVGPHQGPADRLRFPRPVSPPPRPATDPTAPRKPIDAAGTAAFPFGDPRAVGQGKREPIGRSTG